MSARRWAYVAKLVPIGVPVRVPTIKGASAGPTTFDDTTFDVERKTPGRIPVCVNHDRTVDVGRLERVYPQDGWWRVAFVLDREITEELQVGQPVSIGISEWKWGSITLDEVSIVRRCAVRGAEIIERLELGPATVRSSPAPTPTPGSSALPDPIMAKPKPVEARKPAPQPVIATVHRGRPVSDSAWRQELERRLDWLEANTGRAADMEVVLRGLRREIDGPTLDELYAETIVRSKAASARCSACDETTHANAP